MKPVGPFPSRPSSILRPLSAVSPSASCAAAGAEAMVNRARRGPMTSRFMRNLQGDGTMPPVPHPANGGRDLRAKRYSHLHNLLRKFTLYARSEEHTSELQSLMRISYAVFCLKKNKHTQ